MIGSKLPHIRRFTLHVKVRDPLLIGRVFVHHMGPDFPVVKEDFGCVAVRIHPERILRPFLHKNIIVEPVIPVEDRHEAHNFCPMRNVVRCVALAEHAVNNIISTIPDLGEASADQVMDHRDTFRRHTEGHIGEQDVVVDQGRAMTHFHENILAHHAALQLFCEVRFLVIVEQVLRDPRTLRLPVGPDPHGAVMDIVSAHEHIDRGMKLDPCDLGTAKFHHIVDVMDMVVFDNREDPAHTADDAALFAVMDIVAADDMPADLFLQPTVVLSPADRIPLHLGRALYVFIRKIMVIVGIIVLPDTDTGAFAVGDIAFFDDPSFGPVRADHPILKSSRGSPGRSRFADFESAHRNITDTGHGREKAFPAHIELYFFPVRISVLKIHIKDRTAVFLPGVPLIYTRFGFPGSL